MRAAIRDSHQRWLWCAAILFVMGAVQPLRGGTVAVYSTFGARDSFDTSQYYEVGGSPPLPSPAFYAMAFQPSQTVTLDKVRMAIDNLGYGTNLDALMLITTDNGGVPGNFLDYQFVLIGPYLNPGIVEFSSNFQPLLQAGETYWLVLQPTDVNSDFHAGWMLSTPTVAGGLAQQNYYTGDAWIASTETQAAFDVYGTPVSAIPEPSPLIIWSLVAGIFGIVTLRKRVKRTAMAA